MKQRSLPEKPATDVSISLSKGKGVNKGKVAPRPQPVRGKIRLKEKSPKIAASRSAMPEHYAEQSGPKRTALIGEGYVRFRISVGEDGGTSIVDSRHVESELVQPSVIQGSFVYEVTDGKERLHFDSIPDLGVFRSFVNPNGPPEERQHHMYELKSYEFDVRVPVQALSKASLSNVSIALYRVKEAKPDMIAGLQPLHVEYERELRQIARVDGIQTAALPGTLQKQSRRRKSLDR